MSEANDDPVKETVEGVQMIGGIIATAVGAYLAFGIPTGLVVLGVMLFADIVSVRHSRSGSDD